ncbi:Uncharacterized protein ABJ98_2478 [Pseudomonas syringae pv. aceris]|nr:Uncharacterized protein ABJ98_2478 [Pseudomonas syringae pv. aceris]
MCIGVLAVDQAIGVIENTAAGGDCQRVVGCDCAAIAVIQLAGRVEGHQALADQLPGLVVDRRAAPQQQVTAAGQLAAGVGQAAQQVECHIGLAAQVTGAVVEAAAFETETLLGRQITGRVVQGIGFDGQPGTTVDQAVLAVVQQAGDGQGLTGSAGEDAAAVVETVSGNAQRVLADQRTVAAVEQFTGQGCNEATAAAGQGAVVAVVEAVTGDVQTLPARDQTVLVEQVGRVDRQHVAADQLAAAVVEGAAVDSETLRAGDLARLVIQVANAVKGQRTVCRDQPAEVIEVVALHVDGQPGIAHHASAVERQCAEDQGHVTCGRHFAAVAGIQTASSQVQGAGAVDQALRGVVDRCSVEDQAGAAQHLTALVIEAGRAYLERLSSVDQAFVTVGEQAGNRQVQVVAAGQRTARVIERIGGGIDTGGGDHAFDVGQRTGYAQGQQLIAEQFAAAVIQLLGVEGKCLGAGDFTVLVQNVVDVFQQQCARRVDQTALVVQLAVVQVQAQGRVAEQTAALLTQAADTGGQCLAAADAATSAVGQSCARQVQTITAADATVLAVVEIPGPQRQQPFTADIAFLAVIKTGTFQVQCAVGQQLAALVADCPGAVEGQFSSAGNAARGIGQTAGLHRQDIFVADQALCVVECRRQVDAQGFEGAERTTGVVQGATDQRQAALAGEQTVRSVGDLRNVQIQGFLRQHLTAVAVVQLLAGQGHRVLTGQFTATVIDAGDIDIKGLGCADETAPTVIQRVAAQDQCALGKHLTAQLPKAADLCVEVLFAGDLAETVVCCRGTQRHIAVTNQRALDVGQGGIDRQAQNCAAADQAFGVVQAVAASVQRGSGNRTFDVAQRLVDDQRQGLTAEQFATTVIEAVDVESEGLCTGNFAVLVGHAVEILQQQHARGVDQTALVVQLAVVKIEAQRGVAEQLTTLLVEAGDASRQRQRTGNTSGALVDDLACRQSQGIAAGQATALAVVERAGGDLRGALASQFARLTVVQAGADQGQRCIGSNGARLVLQSASGGDAQGIGTGQAACCVLQRGGIDRQRRFTAEQTTAVVQRTGQFDIHVLLAGQSTAGVIQACTIETQGVTEQQAFIQVDQARHGQPKRRTGQDLAAVAVVERLTNDVYTDLAGQLTGLVVDVGNLDFQRFCRAHQAARPVVEGFAGQGQIALRNQLAALLGQTADIGDHVCLTGDTTAAVDNAVDLQLHQASGVEQTVLVVQTRADQFKTGIAVDQAFLRGAQAGLAIVEGIDEQLQAFFGTNRTATVIDTVAMHDQQILCRKTAATVIQRQTRHVHQTLGLQAASGAIVQCAAQLQSQLAIGNQRTRLAVVQTHGANLDALPCTQGSCLIVDGFGDHQFQKLIGHDLASGIVEAQRVEGRVTGAGQFAAAARQLASDVYQQVGIAAQAAAVVIQLIGRQIDAVARHQTAQVGQQLVDTHDQRFVA